MTRHMKKELSEGERYSQILQTLQWTEIKIHLLVCRLALTFKPMSKVLNKHLLMIWVQHEIIKHIVVVVVIIIIVFFVVILVLSLSCQHQHIPTCQNPTTVGISQWWCRRQISNTIIVNDDSSWYVSSSPGDVSRRWRCHRARSSPLGRDEASSDASSPETKSTWKYSNWLFNDRSSPKTE